MSRFVRHPDPFDCRCRYVYDGQAAPVEYASKSQPSTSPIAFPMIRHDAEEDGVQPCLGQEIHLNDSGI